MLAACGLGNKHALRACLYGAGQRDVELCGVAERVREVLARQLWIHGIQVAQCEGLKEIAVPVHHLRGAPHVANGFTICLAAVQLVLHRNRQCSIE